MSTLAAIVVLALSGPGPVHLEWNAPAGCPTAAEVSAQIDAYLAGTARDEAVVEASGRVARERRGLRLELRTVVRGQPGARTLRARDCASLARAAALVVALAVDPTVGERATEPEPEPAPEPAPAAEAPPSEPVVPPPPPARTTTTATPPASPPAPRRSLRDRFALRLLGGLEVGALPGVGALVEASLGYVWPRARLEVFGVYLPPRSRTVPYEGTEGTARFQLGAAGLRGCGQVVRARLEVPLCGGVEAGALDIVTEGFRPVGTRRAPWAAGVAGVHLVVRPLRVLGVTLGADLVVPFTRPTTSSGAVELSEVHRPAPVTGRFAAGIELRFP